MRSGWEVMKETVDVDGAAAVDAAAVVDAAVVAVAADTAEVFD